MSFSIVYHTDVVRSDIPKLDPSTRLRIKKAIETKLLTYPDMFGIPLRHPQAGYRKLRVGDYRVVFSIKESVIRIIAVQHRSIVYTTVPKRQP